MVKLAFEDGKYYIYESRAKSKNQFLLMLDENIKKRKLLDKNMKKHIKNGDYEQKCAEIKNLFLRKIDLDDYPKVMNAITKSNLEMEDYFVVSTKKDPMVSKLKIFDREFVMFACSTGEKVL